MAVNEAGVPIPTGYEGQGNGVTMPGPMSGGAEVGFDPVGSDMSGVSGFQGAITGVQLPGGPDEQGWSFGQDFSGLAPQQAIPMTNQDFGVEEGMLAGWDGDDALFGQVIGRVAGNTDGVQPGDIQAVFNQVFSGESH